MLSSNCLVLLFLLVVFLFFYLASKYIESDVTDWLWRQVNHVKLHKIATTTRGKLLSRKPTSYITFLSFYLLLFPSFPVLSTFSLCLSSFIFRVCSLFFFIHLHQHLIYSYFVKYLLCTLCLSVCLFVCFRFVFLTSSFHISAFSRAPKVLTFIKIEDAWKADHG